MSPGLAAVLPPPIDRMEGTDEPSEGLARLSRLAALSGKLVILPDTSPALIEQYRKLAATLHFAQAERDIKIVMVASSVAGEGKTFTASNLALTLSESYRRRVLLIDADLRRPSVHTVFQIPNVLGLTDELQDNTGRMPPMVQISPNLHVITAGKPNSDPMSSLTSGRMRSIVETAAASFDWVIIDTPPVGLLSDAKLLAAMVHVALLVIRAESTPFPLIKRAVETLGRNRILGVVLNCVSNNVESGGYHYYGYYGGGYLARK